MIEEEIREFVGLEVLVVTADKFRNYGIIEHVSTDATRIRTPHGKVSIINKEIKIVKEKPVRWN